MSKLKERIEEMNKITRKSRRINNILWIVVIVFVGASIYFAFTAELAKDKALIAEQKALDAEELVRKANEQLKNSEGEVKRKLDSMVAANVGDLWQGARTINTLEGYNAYKMQNPNDTIHGEDLVAAVNNLLKKNSQKMQKTES